MIKRQDGSGNLLIIEKTNPQNGVQLIDLYIRLAKESHRRHIGRINPSTRRLHVERSEDMHILKKANAYGFNHHVLKEAQTFDEVILHENGGRRIYRMERKYMLNDGDFLFFKHQGFERQIFLSKEWIEHYEVHADSLKKSLAAEYRITI